MSVALTTGAEAAPTESPLAFGGSLTSAVATPGADTTRAVRARTGQEEPISDQIVSHPAAGWPQHELPAAAEPRQVFDIAMGSATDGWAIDATNDYTDPRLLRWDGAAWTQVTSGAIAADPMVAEAEQPRGNLGRQRRQCLVHLRRR